MTEQMVTIPVSCPLGGAALILQEHRISGAPVVDKDNKVIGMLSQTDLVRHWMKWRDHFHILPQVRVEEEELRGHIAECRETYPALDESDNQLLTEAFVEQDFGDAQVADAYTPYVIIAKPTDTVAQIGRLMATRWVHRIVIVDRGKPVGIVTSFDVMRCLADFVVARRTSVLHTV